VALRRIVVNFSGPSDARSSQRLIALFIQLALLNLSFDFPELTSLILRLVIVVLLAVVPIRSSLVRLARRSKFGDLFTSAQMNRFQVDHLTAKPMFTQVLHALADLRQGVLELSRNRPE
jgi:hypothetical protein